MNKSNVYIIVIKLYNKSKTLLTLDSSIDKKQKSKNVFTGSVHYE